MEVNNTHNIIVSVVGNNSHKIEDTTLTKKVSSTHNIRMRVQQIHIASNQKS